MPIEYIFWGLMILMLVFNFVWTPVDAPFKYKYWGGSLIFWILLAMLGWKVFGSMVK